VGGIFTADINGEYVLPGTLSSNKLDAGSLAQLELAGTLVGNLDGSKVSAGTLAEAALTTALQAKIDAGGVSSGASTTNLTMMGNMGANRIVWTNGNLIANSDGGGNSFYGFFPYTGQHYANGFSWLGAGGDYGSIGYHANHSGTSGELQISVIGNNSSMAICAPVIQFGVGWQPSTIYFQADLNPGANTNFWGSRPLQWNSTVWTNAGQSVVGGSLDAAGQVLPTLDFFPYALDGSAAWTYWGRGYLPVGGSRAVSWWLDHPLLQIVAGPQQAVKTLVPFIQNQAPMATMSAASQALDFSAGQCVQLSNNASAVSFYLTNATGYSTNYEQRVFVLHSGAGLTTTWPTNWNWLNVAPTNLSAGQLLRLNVESLGAYGSNVLVSSATATDMCYVSSSTPYVWDVDALAFLTRAGISTNSYFQAATNVNNLAQNAKTHGWWYSCDCIYPMVGPDKTNCVYNLRTNSWNITWSGCAQSATGMVFNGTSDYGDTHYIPSSAATISGMGVSNAHLFAYVEYAGANATTKALSAISDGGFSRIYWYNDGTGESTTLNSMTSTVTTNPAIRLGQWLVSLSQTNNQIALYGYASTNINTPLTGSALLPSYSFGIASRNAGGFDLNWAGTMAGMTLGGVITPATAPLFLHDWDVFNQGMGRKVP
jgi:hypothetical protein